MPEARTVHVDATLSTLSVKYRNEAMIWPMVLPLVKVGRRSDKFVRYVKEDSFKLADDAIGPKSLPNEADWGVVTDNYSVRDHAMGEWLPQEAIDNADIPLQPEVDTNEFLNLLLDIAQERRVASLVFNPLNYPTGNKVTLSGTSQWGQASASPIANILAAIEGCFIRANTVIMGADTWMVFRRLPEILTAVKGQNGGGLATPEECAGLFEVQNWIVGRGRYITSAEGQTPTFSRLWGKHAAALYVEPNPGIKTITFGVTFSEMFRQTQRDFDPKRGIKGAHYFKTAWNSDEKIIAADLGYMLENVVP
ncbi:MAG: hypothetical protein LBQ00_06810 [Syntrophobacterales bacterium]|jgi:hypothetical protein|nr:hypothetical protein [Syntrophobacterales bacterium]